MKRTLITIALAVLATASAFGQSLSVGAGYTNYKFATKIGDGDASKSDPVNGFYAGVDATVCKLGPVAVTPGLYIAYASTTSSASAFGGLISGEATAKEMYMDIPVNFSYGIDLGAAKVFAYAGPTFSIGALSTLEASGSAAGIGASTDPIDRYDENGNYGRFDVMLGGGLGVDIKMVRISFGYNFGLLDRNTTDSVKYNRSGLHAGVAYLF